MIANKKTVDQIKSDLKLFLGDNADQFIEWYMYTYTLEPLYNIHHWDQHTCLMEMSFVEGSFNILKYQNGTRKVSLVVPASSNNSAFYSGVPLYIQCILYIVFVLLLLYCMHRLVIVLPILVLSCILVFYSYILVYQV